MLENVYSLVHRVRAFGCFFHQNMRFLPTTYSTWVGTGVLFDIRILRNIGHGKNRLCQRKLEVATRSLYTWVKPMSELWRFVYIASQVTLHAKPDAQKAREFGQCLCEKLNFPCTSARYGKPFYSRMTEKFRFDVHVHVRLFLLTSGPAL